MLPLLIVLSQVQPVIANNDKNLTEQFFDAATQINVPGDSTELSVDAGNVAEQNMAAEQVGENTMNAGTNVLLTIKEWMEKTATNLQDFATNIGTQIEQHTGSNPLVTKLLVIFALVFVSIIVIVIMILIAKKFFFKPKNQNPFNNHATEIDSEDSIEEETEEYDEDDEFDESQFEDDEPIPDEYEDDEYDDSYQEVASQESEQKQTEPIQINKKLTQKVSITTPQTIDEAIKNFLSITE